MDGNADHVDAGDDEPSLAAPENATGSQVVYMRGNDQDREQEVVEAVRASTSLLFRTRAFWSRRLQLDKHPSWD
ncbi:hypothetical protein [Methylobacterium longum]|uniref:Uncharacterized protein n=1 Tax=Methylobacterium longum TaxID=767694 RepID=A0ABT8AZE0_9HYPH|nr:hypothetical protein [Methylobacterium longum]MDN3575130.1 hypothetical protein [Methylobacterium longum]GJE15077.1 hypothetical protein FOHLNKBM_6155 [Methylobacterium longum]